VLGRRLSMPMLLGPTGLQRLVHRRADLEVAQAAGDAEIPFVVRASTAFTVEEIADAGSGDLWLQVYPWRDRKALEHVVTRAIAAGYSTLVVTVDVPLLGRRERDLRNGMSIPPRITPRNVYQGARHPRWRRQLYSFAADTPSSAAIAPTAAWTPTPPRNSRSCASPVLPPAANSSARRSLRTMSSAECRIRPAISFIVPSSPTSGHRTLKLVGLIQREHATSTWPLTEVAR